MTWFAVRSVFRFDRVGAEHGTYEERVVLFDAADAEAAIALAEVEAAEYAAIFDDCEALSLFQSYRLADVVGHRAEVFSLMRDSDLDPDDYLDQFFDTGAERQRE
jgi:hypothetical protein